MIKIGQQIGTFNTILVILFTATVGIYYAKIKGINTIKSGMANLYQSVQWTKVRTWLSLPLL